MTTDEQLAALRERRAKITEAPWRKCGGGTACYMAIYSDVAKQYVVFRMASVRADTESRDGAPIKAPDDDQQADNARFIAHAPADIDFLLDLLVDAERERDEAKQRNRDGDDQFCELSAWVKKRFGKDTNRLIGEESGQYTLVGVVMQIVEAELADAIERAADAERAEIVAMLRHRAEKFEASLKIQRRYASHRNMGEYTGVIKQEAFAETYRAAADAIEAGEHRKGGGDGS